MDNGNGKIDLTDSDKALKKLSDLKDKAKDKALVRSIEEKQKYVNKPISK